MIIFYEDFEINRVELESNINGIPKPQCSLLCNSEYYLSTKLHINMLHYYCSVD